MRRAAWLVATAVGFALALTQTPAGTDLDDAAFAVEPTRAAAGRDEPRYDVSIVSSGVTPLVHSATAVELLDGRIRAFWYGGSREGASDVAIYSALSDRARARWHRETVITTREETQMDVFRYVKKLGNPVAARGPDGRLWLFYVSVSVGGWSGSAVNVRVSEDDGVSWSAARRLVTSPFVNISTLVRGPVVFYRDGSMAVPVYHELVGKFGELLRLDPEGRVSDKVRLSWGHSSLQPVMVPLDGSRALVLMRKSGRSPPRILAVTTEDGGRSFGPMETTALANPDAAVSALRLSTGELLVAFNDSEIDRSNLSLAWSEGALDRFEIVHVLTPLTTADEGPPRFAYPWLLQTADGEIHLFYTWNRNRIVHVRFNREWLLGNRS